MFLLWRFTWIWVVVVLSWYSSSELYGQDLSKIDQRENTIKEILSNDPVKAIKMSEALLKEGLESKNDEIIARSNYLLGVGNYYLSRNYLSNEYYKKALKTKYASENEKFQDKCWNNLGINYDIMDKNAEALNAYLKSLKISEKANDSLGIAQTWINIGLLDTKFEHFERAEGYLKRALDYFVRHRDTLNMGLCYQNLAVSYNNQSKIKETLENYLRSLEAYRQVDYQYGIAQAYFNISQQYKIRGDDRLTQLYLDSSLVIAESIGHESLIAGIYLNMANIASNTPKKLEYFNAAKAAYLELGNMESSLTLELEMSKLFATNGDIKNFERSMNQYQEKLVEFIQKNNFDRYEEFQAIYESEAHQNLIAEQDRKLEKRRNLLIGAACIIFMLILFIAVVAFLLLKNQEYIKALYKKNLDIKNSKAFAISEEVSQKAKDPIAEDVEVQNPTEESSAKFIGLYNDIVKAFEEEKIFQNHDLSVSELSSRFNTNDKYISLAIKNHRSGNFNAFVNAYRINEVRKLIAEYGKSISIKELADTVGYKSLNTFYKNFKEITGLTPSQYIELSEDEGVN